MMKKIRDGFPGQRLVIMSRELLDRQRNLPVARHLQLADIGHFPTAMHHFVSRESGLNQYIMIFCASGQGRITMGGKRRNLSAGQLLLIPPGIPHRYESNPAFPWNIYWFHFSGNHAAEYAELLGLDEQDPILQIADTDALIRQFESLYACAVTAFSDPALVAASAELAKTLALVHALRTGKHSKSRRSEERILKSIEYITRQYDQPHTLEELARQASLSVPHYVTLFRRQTGTSPLRYLTRVRLRHACEMLDRTDVPVSEIGRMVGYEDAFYFSRLFRRNTGYSPREFRKLNLNGYPRARQSG